MKKNNSIIEYAVLAIMVCAWIIAFCYVWGWFQ